MDVNSKGIEQQIVEARQEARSLYSAVEKVRRSIQDTSLSQISKSVIKIPPNNYLKLYNTLRGHQDKIAAIRWSKDSNHILSACQDGFMIIWDPVTGLKQQAISLENAWVLTCAYSPNGRLVASGGLDNACTIYQVKRNPFEDISNQSSIDSQPMFGMFRHKTETILKGHVAYISDCDFINDINLVTASGDMTCCLWDINKSMKIRDFTDHLGDVLCLSINPNMSLNTTNLFVSGSSDGYAKLWDVRSKGPVQNLAVSNSDVNCIKQFSDNNSFITGSDDGLVRFFDFRSDCEINKYSLSSYLQSKSPVKENMAMSSSDGSISELQSTYDTPGVISVDFSTSGRFIYACYANYGCIVWDSLRSEIIGSIGDGSHSNVINQVKVSPDGIGLCTSSWDSTIKVWSV